MESHRARSGDKVSWRSTGGTLVKIINFALSGARETMSSIRHQVEKKKKKGWFLQFVLLMCGRILKAALNGGFAAAEEDEGCRNL